MSEKRRDSRNRILRSGESQRADGRYMYKYTAPAGRVKYVYSWRLDRNDRIPVGKQGSLSLREKERQIEAEQFQRIMPDGGNLTVLDLARKYVSLKTGVRHNTAANYKFLNLSVLQYPISILKTSKSMSAVTLGKIFSAYL